MRGRAVFVSVVCEWRIGEERWGGRLGSGKVGWVGGGRGVAQCKKK